MPLHRHLSKKKNKGVHTSAQDFPDDKSLKDELVQVINLMGPDTPHFRTLMSDEERSVVTENDGITIHCNKMQHNEEDTNTPRDYSEMSSIPTDSVDVYIDHKQNSIIVDNNNIEKDNSPFKNITTLFNLKAVKELNNGIKLDNGVKQSLDLYRINIMQPKNDHSAPKRVVFELIDELPKPCQNNAATNTSARSPKNKDGAAQQVLAKHLTHPSLFRNIQRYTPQTAEVRCASCIFQPAFDGEPNPTCDKLSSEPQRVENCYTRQYCHCPLSDMAKVEVYYFDHGNSAYYHTTDSPPIITTEMLAEKTENYTIKFWAEIFGSIHIGFSFFTSFVLQLLRFFLQSFVRPLTVGIIQLLSDYFIKPCLATLFNALIQPPLIFVYNICTTLRDICEAIAEGVGHFCRQCAVLLSAIRFVDVRKEIKARPAACKCITYENKSTEIDLESKEADNNNNNYIEAEK